MTNDTQCGEFSFTPFWGMLIAEYDGAIRWEPNPNLMMSPVEQFKQNEKYGHFDPYDIVNKGEWREQ